MATWSGHTAKVTLLLSFGKHVLSVDIEGCIFIWTVAEVSQNNSPIGQIQLGENFSPSCIMHPDTYLNKVIIFDLSSCLCRLFLCLLSFFLNIKDVSRIKFALT